MTVSRRSFFKLTAGAAIAAVAAPAFAEVVPILYGDGKHDDAPALNALYRGDVIEFAHPDMAEGAGWFGRELVHPSGMFACSGDLYFPGSDRVNIRPPSASFWDTKISFHNVRVRFDGGFMTGDFSIRGFAPKTAQPLDPQHKRTGPTDALKLTGLVIEAL